MATQQIEEFNIMGQNLADILAQYKAQKEEATEGKLTTDILATGEFKKLGEAFTKGKKAITEIPEGFEKLGKISTEKIKELSTKGEELLKGTKQNLSSLLEETRAKAKDIASMERIPNIIKPAEEVETISRGLGSRFSQFLSKGQQALQNYKDTSGGFRAETLRERAFNLDPEIHQESLNPFSKMKFGSSVEDLKKSGEQFSNDFRENIKGKLGSFQEVARGAESKIGNIGEEALETGKAVLETAGKDILASVGEALGPLGELAEAVALGASAFGIKTPSIPQPSLPALQVL
jgi:hypothetical protein